jgi:hypothetical protein
VDIIGASIGWEGITNDDGLAWRAFEQITQNHKNTSLKWKRIWFHDQVLDPIPTDKGCAEIES